MSFEVVSVLCEQATLDNLGDAEDIQRQGSRRATEMINSVSRWVAAATVFLLASAPDASIAQDISHEQSMESLFSISGQVVDAPGGYYVVRSEGGRTKIRFRGWPSDLPGDRSVLSIGDNVTAVGWLGPDALTVDGILDIVGVYVEDRHAYFVLSQSEVSSSKSAASIFPPSGGFGPVDGRTSLTGVISEIGEDELTLRAGDVQIPTETSSLSYDPFDDIGSQRLSLGDTVTVGGILERNAEKGPRLRAARVTSIFVISAAM